MYMPVEYRDASLESKLCCTHLYYKNRITVDKMQKIKPELVSKTR